MRFQKILVGLDNSPLCQSVFAAAVQLAHSNQAAMLLLNCLTTEMVGEPSVPMALDTGLHLGLVNNDYQTQQILMEQQMEQSQTLLKQYEDQARQHGISTTTDYKVGEPGVLLCQVAQDWGADLVVVGRKGFTGLVEALVGSVSNYVVHHAPCSVLVIQEVEPEPVVLENTDLSSVVIPSTSKLES